MSNIYEVLRLSHRNCVSTLNTEAFAATAARLGVWVAKLKAASHHFVGIVEVRAPKVKGALGIYQDLGTRRAN